MSTNNMASALKYAMEIATGADVVTDGMNIKDIVDIGNDTTILTSKDAFVKALVNVLYKNMYTDAAYSDRNNDIFYEDQAEYGAAMQVISIDVPEVTNNPAWNAVTSGTTKLHDTPVTLPVVNGKIYGNADTWAINIAFTGEQLNTAFDSEEKLTEFYNYVRLQVENSVILHRKTMAMINRNAWIANVITQAESSEDDARPFRCINLVQDFCNEMGVTTGMTVRTFLANTTAIAWVASRLAQYAGFLTEYNTAFSGDSKIRFVPENRLVVQMLESFENLLTAEVIGRSYNDRVVSLPLHRTVPFWMGTKSNATAFDFDTLSTVYVTDTEAVDVDKSGIVGIMVDKYAIMHTSVSRRVGVDRDDVKDLTLYSYQFVDRYMNNLTLPGIVFTLEDVSAA